MRWPRGHWWHHRSGQSQIVHMYCIFMLGALVAPTRIAMSSNLLKLLKKKKWMVKSTQRAPSLLYVYLRSRLGHKWSFKFKAIDRSCDASFMVNLGHKFDYKVISNVWCRFKPIIAKVRSRSGQKGQILNLINVSRNSEMQFVLRNPMVSFVLLYDV